jgi:hypothetical protein
MTEADFIGLLKSVLATSGGSAAVWFVVQYLVKDWMGKREKLIQMEKLIAERTTANLAEGQASVKDEIKKLHLEVEALREYVITHRAVMTETGNNLTKHSDQLERTVKAFTAYVHQSHERIVNIETELVKLGANSILVKTKK